VGKLTGGSFCAKEGRRKVVSGEGRSSATTAMADGVWGLTSAGVGHGPRSWRDGGASGRGRATQSARNRSGAAKLGRWNVDGELCSLPLAVLRGRRREERDGTGSFEACARGEERRSGAIADAWKRRADGHSRRYGRRATPCRAHEIHCFFV